MLQDNMPNYGQSVINASDSAVASAEHSSGKQYGIVSNKTEHFNTKQTCLALVNALFDPVGITARVNSTLPRARALKDLEARGMDWVIGLSWQANQDNFYYLKLATGLIEQRLFMHCKFSVF